MFSWISWRPLVYKGGNRRVAEAEKGDRFEEGGADLCWTPTEIPYAKEMESRWSVHICAGSRVYLCASGEPTHMCPCASTHFYTYVDVCLLCMNYTGYKSQGSCLPGVESHPTEEIWFSYYCMSPGDPLPQAFDSEVPITQCIVLAWSPNTSSHIL